MTARIGDGAAHPGIAFTALGLSVLLAALGTSIANVALPAVSEAFGAPFAAAQGVVVAYLAGLTVFAPLAGRLGDGLGLKPMLLLGLILFALASAVCACASGLTVLLAARALQGAGAAFMMTLATALMRETAGAARMGRAMGLMGTVSAVGTALGPALGGVLLGTLGWRSLFLLLSPLAAGALALAAWGLPAATAEAAPLPGSAEGTDGRLLPRLWPNLLANLLVAMVMMATLVVGPFYLRLSLGLTDAAMGLALAVGPALSILSGVPAGRLVDRHGAGPAAWGGLILLAMGAGLLALLPPEFGLCGYVAALLVLTPGYQLFLAANTTATLANVPPVRRGTASGLLGLSRNLGLMAGAAVLGALFAHAAGLAAPGAASPDLVTAGMRTTFLVAAGLMLAAAMITRPPRRQ